MMLHRGGNDDSVHVGAVKKLLRLCDALDVRIQRADMFQALRINVADGFELAVRKAFEVANQKWSPVTAPDYADCDLFLHLGADSANACKIGAGEERVVSCRLCCAASLDSTNCPAITAPVFNMIFRSRRIDRFLR